MISLCPSSAQLYPFPFIHPISICPRLPHLPQFIQKPGKASEMFNSSPFSHRACRKWALDSSLPSGLHDILPQLLQVFSASAGQVKFPGGEILVGQEAELFLGTEASCSTKVMKSLSPLSPEGLYGLFLPETKCD